jgi:hypothetical protein
MASGWINECNGCMEVVSPSGLGELATGLLVTMVALAPGFVLHRILRGRGR